MEGLLLTAYIFLYVNFGTTSGHRYLHTSKDQLKILMPKEEGKKKEEKA